MDLSKVLNAMKESELSKLTKLQTHELDTWLNKVTRTMDGVHPMVSRYFRFVKKSAEEAYEMYLLMSQLDRIAYRPSMTAVEVRWDRIENKLRVLLFAGVPESIAWSSQLAGRERCTDILFDVMVEVAPGNKRDRTQVYKDLIWKENVDLIELHDNLHRWMFTQGRLGKFHVVRPDSQLTVGCAEIQG